MIEIKNGRIYIYNKYKQTLPVLDFKCLSAYVCPECKNVIRAYFVGYVMEESLREYMENDKMKYAYETGSSEGGQWISLYQIAHKEQCRWEVLGALARGAEHSVDSFLKINETKVQNRRALIDAIDAEKLPGFKKVKDEMAADLPLFIYNQDTLIGGKDVSFDERWERMKNIGTFIDSKLIELNQVSADTGAT